MFRLAAACLPPLPCRIKKGTTASHVYRQLSADSVSNKPHEKDELQFMQTASTPCTQWPYPVDISRTTRLPSLHAPCASCSISRKIQGTPPPVAPLASLSFELDVVTVAVVVVMVLVVVVFVKVVVVEVVV